MLHSSEEMKWSLQNVIYLFLPWCHDLKRTVIDSRSVLQLSSRKYMGFRFLYQLYNCPSPIVHSNHMSSQNYPAIQRLSMFLFSPFLFFSPLGTSLPTHSFVVLNLLPMFKQMGIQNHMLIFLFSYLKRLNVIWQLQYYGINSYGYLYSDTFIIQIQLLLWDPVRIFWEMDWILWKKKKKRRSFLLTLRKEHPLPQTTQN